MIIFNYFMAFFVFIFFKKNVPNLPNVFGFFLLFHTWRYTILWTQFFLPKQFFLILIINSLETITSAYPLNYVSKRQPDILIKFSLRCEFINKWFDKKICRWLHVPCIKHFHGLHNAISIDEWNSITHTIDISTHHCHIYWARSSYTRTRHWNTAIFEAFGWFFNTVFV